MNSHPALVLPARSLLAFYVGTNGNPPGEQRGPRDDAITTLREGEGETATPAGPRRGPRRSPRRRHLTSDKCLFNESPPDGASLFFFLLLFQRL